MMKAATEVLQNFQKRFIILWPFIILLFYNYIGAYNFIKYNNNVIQHDQRNICNFISTFKA